MPGLAISDDPKNPLARACPGHPRLRKVQIPPASTRGWPDQVRPRVICVATANHPWLRPDAVEIGEVETVLADAEIREPRHPLVLGAMLAGQRPCGGDIAAIADLH